MLTSNLQSVDKTLALDDAVQDCIDRFVHRPAHKPSQGRRTTNGDAIHHVAQPLEVGNAGIAGVGAQRGAVRHPAPDAQLLRRKVRGRHDGPGPHLGRDPVVGRDLKGRHQQVARGHREVDGVAGLEIALQPQIIQRPLAQRCDLLVGGYQLPVQHRPLHVQLEHRVVLHWVGVRHSAVRVADSLVQVADLKPRSGEGREIVLDLALIALDIPIDSDQRTFRGRHC